MMKRVVEATTPWPVEKTTQLYGLVIKEGAKLIPPEGKVLTMTVNGIGHPIAPGEYYGDVVITVSEPYDMGPHGLMVINQIHTPMRTAAVIQDNKLMEEYGIPAIISRGVLSETEADGIYISSDEEDFNGLILDGDTKYTVRNARFDMEGNGHNDWVGLGSAILAMGNTELTVSDSRFSFSGYTRCPLHIGGNANVKVERCRIINMMPDARGWSEGFTWQCGLRGGGRLTQLCDNARVHYKDCEFVNNGWGVNSIDGSDEYVDMYIENCDLTLSGPCSHGYGAFCVGPNHITYDHSRVEVNGYPAFLFGMDGSGRFDIINGTKIYGRRFGVLIQEFGAMILKEGDGVLHVSDSSIETDKSCIVSQASAPHIEISRSSLKAGNGVILQLADTDQYGLNAMDFKVPAGVVDVRIPDRDVTTVSPTDDVMMELSECELTGDFFNSTSNIRAAAKSTVGTFGKLHDQVVGLIPNPHPDRLMPKEASFCRNGDDFCGPKNLGVNMKKTSLTGKISSALQAYRDGLAVITVENRHELCNITQWAAPTVNNGVVVTLDSESTWTVTGTCYITGLDMAEGSVVQAEEGKNLRVVVNGVETELTSGVYKGTIELYIE